MNNIVNNNVPELRFGEFSEDWDNGFLSELIISLDAGVSVNSENRQAKHTEKGILKTSCVTNGYFDSTENKVVNNEDEILRLKEPVHAETIIISRMNTPALVGANSYVDSNIPNLFLPDRLWAAKINNEHFPKWVGILVAHSNTRNIFSARGTGTSGSMKNITKGDVLTTPICYPKLKEQQKIANFLTSVDQRISLLKQKKAALEQYKKGLMQKIFSQEIRFKPDSKSPLSRGDLGVCSAQDSENYPDWEEKWLGEVITIGSGKDYKHLSKGKYPVYGTGGLMTSVNEYLYDGESVGIGRKGTIDKPMFLSGKFWTVDTLFYTHNFKGVTPFFIFQLFQLINWKKYNEASGVPSLSKATIEKIDVRIPSLNEQQKIAEFLSTIDQSITQLTKQINQTTQFKKGILQRMFV